MNVTDYEEAIRMWMVWQIVFSEDGCRDVCCPTPSPWTSPLPLWVVGSMSPPLEPEQDSVCALVNRAWQIHYMASKDKSQSAMYSSLQCWDTHSRNPDTMLHAIPNQPLWRNNMKKTSLGALAHSPEDGWHKSWIWVKISPDDSSSNQQMTTPPPPSFLSSLLRSQTLWSRDTLSLKGPVQIPNPQNL